jgi:hypothetical protein
LEARFVRVEEVVGSNPATPTGRKPPDRAGQGVFFWSRALIDVPSKPSDEAAE